MMCHVKSHSRGKVRLTYFSKKIVVEFDVKFYVLRIILLTPYYRVRKTILIGHQLDGHLNL